MRLFHEEIANVILVWKIIMLVDSVLLANEYSDDLIFAFAFALSPCVCIQLSWNHWSFWAIYLYAFPWSFKYIKLHCFCISIMADCIRFVQILSSSSSSHMYCVCAFVHVCMRVCERERLIFHFYSICCFHKIFDSNNTPCSSSIDFSSSNS